MSGKLTRGLRAVAEDQPLPPDHDRRPVSPTVEDMYRSQKRGLLRFVARSSHRDEAEDVVHQVFARVAGAEPEAIAAPREYLRKAARNVLRDRARALARRGGNGVHVPLEDAMLADLDPVAALEARDRLARIDAAVSRLKPLARQIFLARRLDGFTYAEIALQTGLSVRGVEKQMNRALKLLNRHLLCDD